MTKAMSWPFPRAFERARFVRDWDSDGVHMPWTVYVCGCVCLSVSMNIYVDAYAHITQQIYAKKYESVRECAEEEEKNDNKPYSCVYICIIYRYTTTTDRLNGHTRRAPPQRRDNNDLSK